MNWSPHLDGFRGWVEGDPPKDLCVSDPDSDDPEDPFLAGLVVPPGQEALDTFFFRSSLLEKAIIFFHLAATILTRQIICAQYYKQFTLVNYELRL